MISTWVRHLLGLPRVYNKRIPNCVSCDGPDWNTLILSPLFDSNIAILCKHYNVENLKGKEKPLCGACTAHSTQTQIPKKYIPCTVGICMKDSRTAWNHPGYDAMSCRHHRSCSCMLHYTKPPYMKDTLEPCVGDIVGNDSMPRCTSSKQYVSLSYSAFSTPSLRWWTLASILPSN